MNINDLMFPTTCVRMWLENQLNTPGPWNYKSCFKSKVNCLLRYKLSGCDYNSIQLRGYLYDNEPDHIWIDSLYRHIFPFIHETFIEVHYG